MILRISHNQQKFKGIKNLDAKDDKGTTVFGDDPDEDVIFDTLKKTEYDFELDIVAEDREEMKQLKEQLISLCYSIYEIVVSSLFIASKQHQDELKDFINDVLLWIHVKEKITKIEFMQKIDEINKISNDIAELYEKNQDKIFDENKILQSIKSDRDELEQLCYAIKTSIMSNILSLTETKITELHKLIDDILTWLIEIDINEKQAELKNEEYKLPDDVYSNKINEINDFCTLLYQNMIGVNIQTVNIIDENVIVVDDKSQCGISMADLMKQQSS